MSEDLYTTAGMRDMLAENPGWTNPDEGAAIDTLTVSGVLPERSEADFLRALNVDA